MGRFSVWVSDTFSHLTKAMEKYVNKNSFMGHSASLTHLSLVKFKHLGVIWAIAAHQGAIVLFLELQTDLYRGLLWVEIKFYLYPYNQM